MRLNIVAYQQEIGALMAAAKGSTVPAEPIRVVSANKVYRIDAQWVDFLEPMPPVTPLPRSERFVLGACHARGRVLTVLDLALVRGETSRPLNSKLIALRGRDLALCAPLATQHDIERLDSADFCAEVLGQGARFLSHLS